MKLATDGEAIGSTQAQFAYVYHRLDKMAWKNASTYVQAHQGVGTPQGLLDYLEQMYGDPNIRERAARRLHELRQPDDMSFKRFLPRLERQLADADALNWPDQAKRQILINALNPTMISALMNRGVPRTFGDLVNRLHEISNDQDSLIINNPRMQANGANRRKAASPTVTHYDNHADEMDWAPTRANRVRAASDTLAKRARWVDEDEMDRRREKGLCFRCGREGCQVATCPFFPPVRPGSKSRAAKTVTTGKGRKGTKPSTRARKSRSAIPSESESGPSEGDTDLEGNSEKD